MVKQIIKWLLALLKTRLMPRKGDTGQDVKIIQEALGLKADGIYGPATEKAVKGFQSKNGLVADGIAGPKTMEVMFPSTDLQEIVSSFDRIYLLKILGFLVFLAIDYNTYMP